MLNSGDPAFGSGGIGWYVVDLATSGRALVVPQSGGFLSPLRLNADGSKLIYNGSLASQIAPNLYVRAVPNGAESLVTAEPSGAAARTGALFGGASADFAVIGFSSASPLVPETSDCVITIVNRRPQPSCARQAYAKNMSTGVLTLLSRAAAGGRGNGSSEVMKVSADGTHAFFSSDATNLLATPPTVSPGATAIYDKNLVTGDLTYYGELNLQVPCCVGSGVLSGDWSSLAFRAAVQALVQPGWLTQQQADTLKALANTL
jgi:hypothetical protein